MLDINDDPTELLDDNWKFLNDPSSKKFQVLEAVALIVYARNSELLHYFNRLNKEAKSLMSQINLCCKSQTKRKNCGSKCAC
jgi:hypothetical protein